MTLFFRRRRAHSAVVCQRDGRHSILSTFVGAVGSVSAQTNRFGQERHRDPCPPRSLWQWPRIDASQAVISRLRQGSKSFLGGLTKEQRLSILAVVVFGNVLPPRTTGGSGCQKPQVRKSRDRNRQNRQLCSSRPDWENHSGGGASF